MLERVRGNLLDADVEALVNTVNTVGVMGKGVALQFRQAFPENYEVYRKACQRDEVRLGRMLTVPTGLLGNPRYIINFPTKGHWRGKSRLEDIEAGLTDLVKVLLERRIRSVALPPLGCGNGGLDWDEVRPRVEVALAALPDVRVLLFEPDGSPDAESMRVRTQRPKMTRFRAVFLMALERYGLPSYRLSMLEMEKLAYFLQEAGEPLRLEFVRGRYGPHAEALHHALQHMEGHFLRGYGDRSRAASVRVLPDALAEAKPFLEDYPEARARLERVGHLIEGYETPYSMELLATIHWLAHREEPKALTDPEAAVAGVHAWNAHKRLAFRPDHVRTAWNRLRDQEWL